MRGERGSTIVEFTLVSLVAFTLMFGMAQTTLIVLGNSVGANAARDGARAAIIDYVGADEPGSPANLAITSAVSRRLAGAIADVAATVTCRPADDMSASVPCQPGSVDLDRGDLVEVSLTWKHRGYSLFVDQDHRAIARMVIGGAPDLSATPTTAPATTTTTAGGTTTTTGAPTTTTTTTPAGWSAIASQMADADGDGRVDRVQVTFSGALDPACTAGWTLAHVPSGGTLSGVTIAGSTATLAVAEGSGAPDTGVGGFTVAFAGCSNANAFPPTAPTDGAAPVFVALADSGGVDGKAEPGDVLDVTFSETVAPTWGPSLSVLVVMDRHGNSDAEISVPTLVSGTTFSAGSPAYVAKNKTVTFSDSTLSASGPVVRLTLGPSCTGCGDAGTGQGSFTFIPGTSIRDAAGSVSVAAVSAVNHKLF